MSKKRQLATTDGKPTAIGVTFTESALSGFPQSPTLGLTWTEFLLPLPPEASATGFDHIGLSWNPNTLWLTFRKT